MLEIGKMYKVVRTDRESDGYVSKLDSYIGREMELFGITNLGWGEFIESDGWVFHPDWLEEVVEQEPQSNVDSPEDFKEQFVQPGYRKRKEWTGKEIADIVTDKKMRVFDTGSKRDADDNKPLPFELNPYTLIRYGYHMKRGSLNYGHGNWEMQQPDIAILQSMSRHFTQLYFNYKFPELAKATDDGSDHASAILFGLNMLMHNECIAGVPADKFFNTANHEK